MSESDAALIEALRALARVRAKKIGTPLWGNLAEAVAANRLEALLSRPYATGGAVRPGYSLMGEGGPETAVL